MNPKEFLNNGYAAILEANMNKKCRVRLLGQYGFVDEGVFIGVSPCKECEESPSMRLRLINDNDDYFFFMS